MKDSSQMIGISIILLFGLGIGLANAATSIFTSSSSGTNATRGHNISANMVGASGISSDLTALNVNYTAVDLLDSANKAAAAEATTESSPTDTASLQASGPMSKISGHTADTGKTPRASAYQTYAMLLVGLGLLGFSARHRTNVI